jgi:hypothetical protein
MKSVHMDLVVIEFIVSELDEADEAGYIHIVDTRSDQFVSDEETTTTSAETATSISWTGDNISPVNVSFTGDFCYRRLS